MGTAMWICIHRLSPALLSDQKSEIISLMEQLSPNDNDVAIMNNYEKMEQFLDDGSAIIFAAEHSGKFVGYIWGYLRQNQGENRIHVTQFVVDREHRGRGVGEQLLQTMDDFAKKMNCDAIELNVLPYNTAAIRLYMKDGFIPQRVFMRRGI